MYRLPRRSIFCFNSIFLNFSCIGFVVGILPGTGGGIGDWTSYSATVALNKKEKVKFGTGNIKGVIGPEGANNEIGRAHV